MCQLLETVKCYNGKLFNLKQHNIRFNKARKSFFNNVQTLDLSEVVKVPSFAGTGLFRCRISYAEQIENVEFIPHQFRPIKSLKIIYNDDIDYTFKYSNRSHLQQLFKKRESCDDILIIKNGVVTDSFTANPVFFDGTKWWTPDTPLLKGTQRERLLQEQKIFECRITVNDIKEYKKIGLINAMQDLNDMPVISTDAVQ